MRTMPWASRPMPMPWVRVCLAAGVVTMPLLAIAWPSAGLGILYTLFALDVCALCMVIFSLGGCAVALHRRTWRPAIAEAGMAVLMAAASASPLVWLALIGLGDGD